MEHQASMKQSEVLMANVPLAAKRDCALFLWCDNEHLAKAIHAMQCWGFTYRAVLTQKWPAAMDTNAVLARQTRQCLIGFRGSPTLKCNPSSFMESLGPDDIAGFLAGTEKMLDGPYLQLGLGKRVVKRKGWDTLDLQGE